MKKTAWHLESACACYRGAYLTNPSHYQKMLSCITIAYNLVTYADSNQCILVLEYVLQLICSNGDYFKF